MEKVTGYRLTDGRVIEDFDEATKAQKELNFNAAIEKLSIVNTMAIMTPSWLRLIL